MHAGALPANPVQIIAMLCVAALAMWLRMRRMSRGRRLRLEQLWIVPAIFTAIVALVLWQAPPQLGDAPWLALALLIGAVMGWYRGKMMRITIDPQTHALNQSASPAAMIFILAIFGLRFLVRWGLAEEAEAWRISVNLLTDFSIILVFAMFVTTRVEMFIRARRMLRDARAAKDEAEKLSGDA